MSLSTHVLDAVRGRAAAGVTVRLDRVLHGDTWVPVVTDTTDSDGRIRFPADLQHGTHRLVFDTAAYFEARGTAAFYPEVAIAFTVADPAEHYHVPLLLSPFAYSTYRGS